MNFTLFSVLRLSEGVDILLSMQVYDIFCSHDISGKSRYVDYTKLCMGMMHAQVGYTKVLIRAVLH